MLRERVGKVPDEVARALDGPDLPSVGLATRWITTGVGASEGPARLLVAMLSEAGIWAEFRPLSAFALGRVPAADACVIFSQHLSPNARLAFRARDQFRTMLVASSLTSSDPISDALAKRGINLISHGPRDERDMLVRVIGSAAACVIAARIALRAIADNGQNMPPWASFLERLPELLRRTHSHAAPLHERMIVVCAGEDPRSQEGLRLKLVEGLGRNAVMLDVCSVVHGPLQSFWSEPATVITLEHEGDSARDLFDRLARVLRPHHQLLRMRATLGRPLGYFEHAAMVDQLVLAGLDAQPRDLFDWPGKGHDSPLYDVGSDALDEEI